MKHFSITMRGITNAHHVSTTMPPIISGSPRIGWPVEERARPGSITALRSSAAPLTVFIEREEGPEAGIDRGVALPLHGIVHRLDEEARDPEVGDDRDEDGGNEPYAAERHHKDDDESQDCRSAHQGERCEVAPEDPVARERVIQDVADASHACNRPAECSR